MSATLFWIAIGFALWLLGLHGLLTLRHALRRIIAINLMGSGVFLVMIAFSTPQVGAQSWWSACWWARCRVITAAKWIYWGKDFWRFGAPCRYFFY